MAYFVSQVCANVLDTEDLNKPVQPRLFRKPKAVAAYPAVASTDEGYAHLAAHAQAAMNAT